MVKSPTLRLLLGLLVTLAAVAGFSSYTLKQLDGLEALQTQTIDLNRHDSLLLLRVESDLNMIGLRLRDMTRRPIKEDIGEFRDEIDRLHADLQDAIEEEEKLTPATRRADQHAELIRALKEFWQSSDAVFAAANAGHHQAARVLASTTLFRQQAALAARVSHLLERNNEAERWADQKVASIYEGVERDLYAFLAATIVAIVLTSLYLIYSNRRTFERMESLSRQRRILAARLITVQEEVLRSVSRELHDEFGQILTAVGAMLARAERKGVPPDSPLRTELSEVREITHNALEKVRSLSQMLHPSVIDDYGLVKGIAHLYCGRAGADHRPARHPLLPCRPGGFEQRRQTFRLENGRSGDDLFRTIPSRKCERLWKRITSNQEAGAARFGTHCHARASGAAGRHSGDFVGA
jgi:hypothetical protein